VEAKKVGYDVMGLELSKDLAHHVIHELGIPVFQGLASDPEFTQKFDVIISSQVFEHLLDPRQTLEALLERLASPGLLLIEVPNQNDIRERLKRGKIMNDSHLFYFSASSLSRMLRDLGLKVLKVQEGMRPYRRRTDPDNTPYPELMELGATLLSMAQVKTGLSVFAVKE
jgi:2-polyprenyl-3-methyl-5-hydroxy-6-metoxy-1,4-benzoquinol methylase